MGTFLELYVRYDCISQEDWAATWDLSLALLQRYEGRLCRLSVQEVGDLQRWAFTQRLELSADDPAEHRWRVDGDLDSMRTAESFGLYRLWGAEVPEPVSGGEVLMAILQWWGEEVEAPPHSQLWRDKTQGYPYHLPLLAVGALFEDRFPGAVVVRGDINVRQAQAAVAWAREVMELDLAMPVTADAPRLVERLRPHVPDDRLANTAFRLYVGPHHDVLAALDGSMGRAWFRRCVLQLARGSDYYPKGSTWLWADWLSITHDLEALCDMICRDAAGPRCTQDTFVDRMVGLMMWGPGWSCTVTPDQLADALHATFGRKREQAHAKVWTHLHRCLEEVGAADKAAGTSAETSTVHVDPHPTLPNAPLMDLVWAESLDALGADNRMACSLFWWHLVQSGSRQTVTDGELMDADELRYEIIAALDNVALSEDAWAVLDAETDVTLLTTLLKLACHPNFLLYAATWQLGLFENLDLCRELQRVVVAPEHIEAVFAWSRARGVDPMKPPESWGFYSHPESAPTQASD